MSRAKSAWPPEDRRFRALIEKSSEGITLLSRDGVVLYTSPAIERSLGFSSNEIVGTTIFDWAHPDEIERMAQLLNGLLRQAGGTVTTTGRVRRRNGSWRWMELTLTNLLADHEIGAIVANSRDVTESMQAQAHTAVLLEVATAIAGTLDLAELFERVQQQTARLLPCDSVAVFQTDRERAISRLIAHHGLSLRQQSAVIGLEYPVEAPFGGRLERGEALVSNDLDGAEWLAEIAQRGIEISSLIAAPLRVRGRGLGALVTFNQRPDRPFLGHQVDLVRAIAQQLAVAMEAADLYRTQQDETAVSNAVAQVARETINMLDTPVLLERLCELTTGLLGCSYSHTWLWDADQQAFVILSGHGDSPEQWEFLRALKLSRAMVAPTLARVEQCDLVHLGTFPREGSPLGRLPDVYGVSAGLLCALRRGSEVVGFLTAGYRERHTFTATQERILRGVAQLGALALESARLVDKLESANRLKTDVVATMSHELRTPLSVIMGYSDLLLTGGFGELRGEQEEVVTRIDANARTLLELISATLDMSRIESGQLPLNCVDVDVAAILSQVERETFEQCNSKDAVQFVWEVSAALPRICTDAVKLKVVVKNLLNNAIKFTDRGKITVSAEPRQGGVEFRISDTGIGIDASHQALIFEAFRQVDGSASRRVGGVGLGLYITRRLVQMMSGTIEVSSELQRGSTFRVWLPAGPGEC